MIYYLVLFVAPPLRYVPLASMVGKEKKQPPWLLAYLVSFQNTCLTPGDALWDGFRFGLGGFMSVSRPPDDPSLLQQCNVMSCDFTCPAVIYLTLVSVSFCQAAATTLL